MQKQFLEDIEFQNIQRNQKKIIDELVKQQREMQSACQISQKYLADSIMNFKRGNDTIARIRKNLDQIYQIGKQLKAIKQSKTSSSQ